MSMEPIDDEESESLRTARLVLRRPVAADAPRIAALANDRGIAEMVARLPFPYTLGDAEAFLGCPAASESFALCPEPDGELIGFAGLHSRTDAARTYVLGYWIGRPYWGQGYATEAAQALVDLAFERHHASAVEVRCRVVNGGSRRVIQKCGFQYSGMGMFDTLVAGRVASETYRMDRRCWQSLKSWGSGK